MARVQADPITAALAHPTRRNLYTTLSELDEMSTVQLQESVDVDRYNLYHHLKKLASLHLIENHRDVGRARWWRISTRIDLPGLISPLESTSQNHQESILQSQIIGSDNSVHIIPLDGSRGVVGAKLLFEKLADDLGIEINIPWNFVPGKIVLIEADK